MFLGFGLANLALSPGFGLEPSNPIYSRIPSSMWMTLLDLASHMVLVTESYGRCQYFPPSKPLQNIVPTDQGLLELLLT